MNMPQANSLTNPQVLAMVSCMLAVARIDGIRPEEVAVIRAFYDGSAAPGLPPFAAIENAHCDLATLPGLSGGGVDMDFAEQVVLASFLAGYADGNLSDGERAQVAAIAAQLGLAAARTAELQTQVKDTLIGALAHLPDSASVAALAKTM